MRKRHVPILMAIGVLAAVAGLGGRRGRCSAARQNKVAANEIAGVARGARAQKTDRGAIGSRASTATSSN